MVRHAWLFVTLMVLACDSSAPAPAPAPGAAPAPGVVREETITVFAAASLRETFTALAPAFEHANPGAHAVFNFAGSQQLRTQLEQGAPADVFASADQKNLDALVTAHLAGPPVIFARNLPVVVVPRDSPVKSFADLAKTERVVLGTADVPIGRYSEQILDKAAASPLGADWKTQLLGHVVSRELDVKQVLAKVTLGEAGAGIVYATDAATVTDKVRAIAIPAELNVIAEYPIAVVTASQHAKVAQEWIELLESPTGQAALTHAGFQLPAP